MPSGTNLQYEFFESRESLCDRFFGPSIGFSIQVPEKIDHEAILRVGLGEQLERGGVTVLSRAESPKNVSALDATASSIVAVNP